MIVAVGLSRLEPTVIMNGNGARRGASPEPNCQSSPSSVAPRRLVIALGPVGSSRLKPATTVMASLLRGRTDGARWHPKNQMPPAQLPERLDFGLRTRDSISRIMTNRASPNPLDAPLSTLRGVGAERAAQLARLNLHTTGDLLLHRPRRYEDRTQLRPIADLALGEAATVRGKITALGTKRWRGGSRSVFEFVLE